MLIKVNNEYLEFDGDIDIERQIKLFEEAATTQGDISYDFTIPGTTHNRVIFNLFSINQAGKIIYTNIPTSIENDSGVPLYFGFIKVQKDTTHEIRCNFFSGNSNWLSLLDFKINQFDFSTFDIAFTYTTIAAQESATSGIIFPVINTGVMGSRSSWYWVLEDFQPFVYVHSIIKYVLNRHGIKLEGDILQDWRFNNMITSNNSEGTPQEEINERSTSVGKTTDQGVNTTPAKITFHLESGDYYTGSLWDTATDRYTADEKMIVSITFNVDITTGSDFMHFQIYKNGSLNQEIYLDNDPPGPKTIKGISLESSDYIEFFAYVETGTGNIEDCYVKIIPTKIYRVFTRFLLPDDSAKNFVSGVFALFNPVINYNALSKTLTVDLFNNFIRRPELDISQYIETESIEVDYTELMENYGRKNNFVYSAGSTEAIEKYNDNNDVPFGGGQMDSGNEISKGTVDAFISKFIAVFEDVDNPTKDFLPHLDWRKLTDTDQADTGVSITNSAGILFTASGYAAGDLIKVENSTIETYNGEWVITSATSTTFSIGRSYVGNATADIKKIIVEVDKKNEQALLLSLPNIALSDFSNIDIMFYGTTAVTTPATAYFYKPLQGLNVDDYVSSLSFGENSFTNAFQHTMIDDYWRDFARILSDPIKILVRANFPESIYYKLFDGPLRLKTPKFNSQFSINKITGYKGSHLPCEVELIKL